MALLFLCLLAIPNPNLYFSSKDVWEALRDVIVTNLKVVAVKGHIPEIRVI
jgi:hypothetical protein